MKYSPTLDDLFDDVSAFAIVFVGDTRVEWVHVDVGHE